MDTALGVLADAGNHSLASAANHERITEEEWILLGVFVAFVPLELRLVLIVDPSLGLLDAEVGRFDDEAVGGNLVSRAQLNDISHAQVPNGHGLHGAALAADDGQVLVAAQALQLDELAVLVVVVVGADEHLDDECDENEASFDPAGGGVDDHAGDDADDGEDRDHEEESVVERVLHRAAEVHALRGRLTVAPVPTANQVSGPV